MMAFGVSTLLAGVVVPARHHPRPGRRARGARPTPAGEAVPMPGTGKRAHQGTGTRVRALPASHL